MSTSGKFYIVNVGAGEKDNITLKGYKILISADVVIASENQRKRFREELERKIVIDGGHRLFRDLASSDSSTSETNLHKEKYIRKKVYEYFNNGKTVVLIESGDTAIFSPYRGFLTEFADLNPILVPGVSSFNAANAALGKAILTDKNQQLLMTGLDAIMHAEKSRLPDFWVLFCMQLDLPVLIDKIKDLYPSDKPISFILRAGHKDFEVFKTTVGNLDEFRQISISWPYCLIYIGI